MLQSCLGLGFDPHQEQIVFENPILPDFLDEVAWRNLTVRSSSAAVTLRRSGSQVVAQVLERSGPVRVLVKN